MKHRLLWPFLSLVLALPPTLLAAGAAASAAPIPDGAATYNHHLRRGLNLVCINRVPMTVATAEEALLDIGLQGGDARAISSWQADEQAWQRHVRTDGASDFPLLLGRGYFIESYSVGTWTHADPVPRPPVTVPLTAGWSLICLPGLTGPIAAQELLDEATDLGGGCTEIYRWDVPGGTWQGQVTGMAGAGFDLTGGEGYLVQCASPINYTVAGDNPRPPGRRPVALDRAGALTPSATPTISDTTVTNRRDVALTVTWRTSEPSNGWVVYGVWPAMDRIADDDRGAGTVSYVHSATLGDLAPGTDYLFRVHSGESVDDNGGAKYRVRTRLTSLPDLPYAVYGRVETANDEPASDGALIRAWMVDGDGTRSEPLSTLVDSEGRWSLVLPEPDCEGQRLALQALGPSDCGAALTQPVCDCRPAPVLTLSEPLARVAFLPLVASSSGARWLYAGR